MLIATTAIHTSAAAGLACVDEYSSIGPVAAQRRLTPAGEPRHTLTIGSRYYMVP
jgi:hypothetical protein